MLRGELSMQNSSKGRATRNAGAWIKQGRSPASLLKVHAGGLSSDRYMQKAKGSVFLDSNLLSSTYQDRKKEWRLDQARHPLVSRLFQHVSISVGLERTLSRHQWISLFKQWLFEVGASDVSYVAYLHTNTKCPHIHLLFSRAKPSGELVPDSHNFYRWKAALRLAEEKNGLSECQISREGELLYASDRHVSAIRRSLRRGTLPNFLTVGAIERCLVGCQNFVEFSNNLLKGNVEIRPSYSQEKILKGYLFRAAGSEEWIAGTSISQELSSNRINKLLLENCACHQADHLHRPRQ